MTDSTYTDEQREALAHAAQVSESLARHMWWEASDAHDAPGDSWCHPRPIHALIHSIVTGTRERTVPTVGHLEDGTALFYAGRVNGIHGDSGAGKTWTALAAVKGELERGETVFYVDLEDDEGGLLERLIDLGTKPADLEDRFIYLGPTDRLDEIGRDGLRALVANFRPTLVVIDSTGEGLALDGANPNADEDVATWFRRVPRFIADLGPAVVVLDHMAKADSGGLWPIGSQRKRAAVNGAQYLQEAKQPFSRTTAGQAVLKCAKDRHGHYRAGQRVAELRVIPTGGPVTMTLVAVAETDPNEPWRPTGLMERVSEFLAGAPGSSGADIRRAVTGKDKHVLHAISVLVAEGYVTTGSGARGAVTHTNARRFYEADDGREQVSGPNRPVPVPVPKTGTGEQVISLVREQVGNGWEQVTCETCEEPTDRHLPGCPVRGGGSS